MKGRRLQAAVLAGATCAAIGAAPAGASAGAVGQVKSLYKSVMLAEYFGPASGVCSHLTAKGKKAYELEASAGTCPAAFKKLQHTLKHKTQGVDNSGYTPKQWRATVNDIVAHLTVHVNGSRASAVGPSGVPGKTTLVKTSGGWIFTSAAPSPQS